MYLQAIPKTPSKPLLHPWPFQNEYRFPLQIHKLARALELTVRQKSSLKCVYVWVGGWVGGCVGVFAGVRLCVCACVGVSRCRGVGAWGCGRVWVGGWVGGCALVCQCACALLLHLFEEKPPSDAHQTLIDP